MFNAENNRVVRDTGAQYPIIQAPMAWIARAQLASAVSAAGAFGLLESSSRDAEIFGRELAAARAATARPFGINLAIKFLKGDAEAERRVLDQVINSGVRFVTTSAGDPKRYIEPLHEAGIVVYHAVPSLAAALKARDAGVNGLIVEGGESAGIRGPEPVHTFVLLQAVRERVDLPIVAAGGIADGRGIAAALTLGADGVQIGTAFLACEESNAPPAHKEALLNARTSGQTTILTRAYTGRLARGLTTPIGEMLHAGDGPILPFPVHGHLLRGLREEALKQGRLDLVALWSGQSVRLITHRRAGELFDSLITETEHVLSARRGESTPLAL